jgi:hypothetical protein
MTYHDTKEAPPHVGDYDEHAWEDVPTPWWKADRLDGLGWAVLFLWGAFVVVASYLDFTEDYDWWDAWGVFFLGAGVIVLAEATIRLAVPRLREGWGWDLFWGTAFLALGLGSLASEVWYALPLVAIAVVILAGTLRPKR